MSLCISLSVGIYRLIKNHYQDHVFSFLLRPLAWDYCIGDMDPEMAKAQSKHVQKSDNNSSKMGVLPTPGKKELKPQPSDVSMMSNMSVFKMNNNDHGDRANEYWKKVWATKGYRKLIEHWVKKQLELVDFDFFKFSRLCIR